MDERLKHIQPINKEDLDNQLLYVAIYEKLYELIQKGIFKKGEALPGEIPLSNQLGVSRNTLRQALLILQEDGIVYNKKGKGNFVSETIELGGHGLEKLKNAIYTFNKHEYSDIYLETTYEISNNVLKDKLKLDDDELLMVFKRTYEMNGIPVCHGLTFIPYKYITANKIKISDKEDMLKFVDETIYEQGSSSTSIILLASTGEFFANILHVEKGQSLFLLEEVISMSDGNPLAFSKTYFHPNYYHFFFHRT